MTRDRGAQRFNRFMALFFAVALVAIAALLYATEQQESQSALAGREYVCSLAYVPNSSEWQTCVNRAQ